MSQLVPASHLCRTLGAIAVLTLAVTSCTRSSDPPPVTMDLRTTPIIAAAPSVHSEGAAARVPARDRVAEVSVIQILAPNQISAFDPHRVVVTEHAVFTALEDSAEALAPAPPGVESCPADLGVRYVVAFGRSADAAPDVVFTAGGCDHVQVAGADGKPLGVGVLTNSPAFRADYLSALGLPLAG